MEKEAEDYTVKCPKHGSEFDVRTGKNLKGPWIPFGKATDLKAHKVSKGGKTSSWKSEYLEISIMLPV